MKSDKVIMTGIITLAVMQISAMYFGINGTFRTYIVGGILLLLGVQLPKEKLIKTIRSVIKK